eukprot:2808848-Pleurochrysis_carterae.AAC.1
MAVHASSPELLCRLCRRNSEFTRNAKAASMSFARGFSRMLYRVVVVDSSGSRPMAPAMTVCRCEVLPSCMRTSRPSFA